MGVVDVRVSGPRADLVLRRPEVLNAMSVEVFDALSSAADEVANLDDLRVLVVSGEGRSFSSGIDTSSFGTVAGDPDTMIARAQAGFRKIAALPIPTIAAVRGHALGAGLQLALACDVIVATTDASLGLLEARYGLVPDLGGTQRLPRLVGPARAKRMIWLAERMSGVEAERIGLASRVVDEGELDEAVDRLAAALAGAPPLTVRAVKRLVDLAGSVDHAAGMDEEARAQAQMLTSSDFGEAVSAFIEKREPQFTAS